MKTRDDYLEFAASELERARTNADDDSLEFRNFLVRIAQAATAIAAELRAGEERASIEFEIARRKLMESVDT